MLGKEFAAKMATLIDKIGQTCAGDGSHHSNSIVVVDAERNVAAVTHTINSVVWGSTGVVVGGIPIPESAGFQQLRLATLKPGTRVPNEMVQTVVLKVGNPIVGIASIGSGLVPESLKLLLSVVGQKRCLAEVQTAPPLMTNFAISGMDPTKHRSATSWFRKVLTTKSFWRRSKAWA
jgi:gamma-glutamyltranspeptidase/glutathione hydrolase